MKRRRKALFFKTTRCENAEQTKKKKITRRCQYCRTITDNRSKNSYQRKSLLTKSQQLVSSTETLLAENVFDVCLSSLTIREDNFQCVFAIRVVNRNLFKVFSMCNFNQCPPLSKIQTQFQRNLTGADHVTIISACSNLVSRNSHLLLLLV